MTNEEKAQEIVNNQWEWIADFIEKNNLSKEDRNQLRFEMYNACLDMGEWKDEQPIKESGGWHTEQPTEDGWYLVDTPDFPKNCHFVVAEWDNDAKNFYDEHSDYPIKFIGWKLIERR